MNEFWEWFENYASPKLGIRSAPFRRILQILDKFKNPVIIETGCVDETTDEAWLGFGCSTILFDKYVSLNDGYLWSVDKDKDKVERARQIVSPHTIITCDDSIKFLEEFVRSNDQFPHLVYLDSYDDGVFTKGEDNKVRGSKDKEMKMHQLNELRAIVPKLTADTILAVDDSILEVTKSGDYAVSGRGEFVATRAAELGASLLFSQYISVWSGFTDLRAVDTDHKSSFLLLTKSTHLRNQEDYEASIELLNELISRGDLLAAAYYHKGLALAFCNKHEEAIDCYRKAIDQVGQKDREQVSIVRYEMSLSLFSVGRQKEGWQELFHSRLSNENWTPLYIALKRFRRQLFCFQPPPATVHIHADGGHGDVFALIRYLPFIVEKGYTVRFEVKYNSMFELVKYSFPNVEVVQRAFDYPGGKGLKDFDYHLPTPDLPFIFGTDLDTIPWYGPYLKADPKLVKKYEAHKGKIGLCWATGPVAVSPIRYCRRKSVSFELLNPLIDLDPSRFVALQLWDGRLENNRILDCLPIDAKDPTWSDTAALIENLDLVITIDTSIAHLAGAMGKPVWLMMHKFTTSWQFMAEYPGASWNTKSPWYPSMRIFRQKEPGKWDSVINEIVAELDRRTQVAA